MFVLEKYIPLKDKNKQWPQVMSILIASLAAINTGALFTWPACSTVPLMQNDSQIGQITIEQASYFSVIPAVSSGVTSIFIAMTIDVIGRKKMVMFVAIPQFISWLLIACADRLWIIYVSRIFSGIGEAALFGALPTYVGEISEPNVRGSWGNAIAIGLYLGQFLVNLIGKYCSIRTTAIIGGCLPVIHFVLSALFLCESPYFLIMKHKDKEARGVLNMLRWSWNTEQELEKLNKDVKRQISEAGTFWDLVSVPVNRKALIISVVIRGCQQFSGLAAFAVYTSYIFEQAGFKELKSSTCAVIFTLVNLIANTTFAFLVDKFGRKLMMTVSSFGCGVTLMVVATYCYFGQALHYEVVQYNWIPLAGLVVYIILCASGLGIIPTLMLGELFSTSVKSKALCILNIVFAMYVLSVSKLYQTLSITFGMFAPFYLFSTCCFAGTIFSYFCVPETKGKTLEEIQQLLKDGKSFKRKSKNVVC